MTSVVAELDDDIVGFISAYINPNKENTIFIWQIAVSSAMRGHGLGTNMIKNIMERDESKNVKFIEATVTPSNKASMMLFQKIALLFETKCEKQQFFTEKVFGDSGHEEELLLRIGPLNKKESVF